MVDFDIDDAQRTTRTTLRYERIHMDGTLEALERDWTRSWWPQPLFQEMLTQAHFTNIRIITPNGQTPAPNATDFIFLARKE